MAMDLGRIITIRNITTQEFTHSYHGQPFTLRAGESLTVPYDLGRHLAKHLARRILFSDAKPEQLRNDRAIFTKESESELMSKIMGQETRQSIPKELSEAERLRARVEELNAQKPEGVSGSVGRTKADVIAEMETLKLPIDKRLSMAKLEEQLAEAKKLTA